MGTRSVLKPTVLTLAALLLAAAGFIAIAGWFADYEIGRHGGRVSRPRVVGTRPVDGELAAPADGTIRIDLFLPMTGRGVDAHTLDESTVRLIESRTGDPVPAHRTAAADGSSLALTPAVALTAGEEYRLEVTDGLKDEAGEAFIPYGAWFRVAAGGTSANAADHGFPAAYEQVPLTESLAPSVFTTLAFGPAPDGGRDLFAGTADGRIFRFGLKPDGTLKQRSVLTALQNHNKTPRLISGLAFDPDDPGILWVSHGVAALSGAPDFTGKISTLSGNEYGDYSDRITGLPRAFRDHLNFGIAFAADRLLYLSQGSNTSTGLPDTKWNNRPERLLTAAILRIDTSLLPQESPLDVRTPDGGGQYDPFASNAPLKLHATGVRSGYTLIWHSSGRLLTAINGAGRGGNTPPITDEGSLREGPLMGVGVTTDDTLADLTAAGTYHGHPNPTRGEHVLMGGNPTARPDPYEVPDYSTGTMPERHFAMPMYNFGKGYSPNGVAESRAPVFGGAMKGALLVARFSAGDDILVLRINRRGEIFECIGGIKGLTNLGSPLALVEDQETGNVYVSEFDTQRLLLLRPIDGGTTAVRRQLAP